MYVSHAYYSCGDFHFIIDTGSATCMHYQANKVVYYKSACCQTLMQNADSHECAALLQGALAPSLLQATNLG